MSGPAGKRGTRWPRIAPGFFPAGRDFALSGPDESSDTYKAVSENPGKTRSFGIAEIIGTGLALPAILILLALLSYEEPPANGEAVGNLIGTGGHYAASLLFYLFGFAAFVLPPYALAVGGYALLTGRLPDLLLRSIALFILIIAGAVLIFLVTGSDETQFWSGGGVMGRRLGDALETIFGRYGAFILATGVLLPGLLLGSPYSLPELWRRITAPLLHGAVGSVALGRDAAAALLRVQPGSKKSRPDADSPGGAVPPVFEKVQELHTEEPLTMNENARNPGAKPNLPFFLRAEATRKPWFEAASVGPTDSPTTPPLAPAPGVSRGHLSKISPTYGRRVELDNAFLLSARARHVRNLLAGLGEGTPEESNPGKKPDRTGLRPPVSLRGGSLGGASQGKPEREGRDPRGGVRDYAGFFTEDDSRFHFRNLDLSTAPSGARTGTLPGETIDSDMGAPDPREHVRPAAAESLLRPINLKILEREFPGRRDLARDPVTDGALALERAESAPLSTRLVENFPAAPVLNRSAVDREDRQGHEFDSEPASDFANQADSDQTGAFDESPAEPDEEFDTDSGFDEDETPGADAPDFLQTERAVEAALSGTRAAWDEPVVAAAPDRAPEAIVRRGPEAERVVPPFPDLPAVQVLRKDYYIPRDILRMPARLPPEDVRGEIELTKQRLEKVLRDFGVQAEIVRTQRGPIITLYEIRPDAGVKVSRIMGIVDEIKMNLEARSVRIIAPIPGKNTVGIEIPNRRREEVTLGELVRHDPGFFAKSRELSLAMGKDISGENQYMDLTRLPHLLIAGATGAGKSVYMNSIIASLLYTRSPQELRFIMIDPKMVELTLFEGIPHLLMPVITDVRRASKALNWAVNEMERRYAFLSYMKCRDIRSYNEKFNKPGVSAPDTHMPYLVIFIDELSDLMIMAPKDVEDSIIRLTQKARAVGIHIVMATQRPSVDVITALIKANCPARIAFQVAQKTDSRVILDSNGAETLLGRGDMLYKTPAATGLVRIQTPLIEENEIERIVEETRRYGRPAYIELPGSGESDEEFASESEDVDRGLFDEAWRVVAETGKTSTSYIQRRLRIGYNRAARIIEMMEERGYLGPQIGNRPREILKKD